MIKHNIQLLHYVYNNINISIPTHYNKHDMIFNSYKYDIESCVMKFLTKKIQCGEIQFIYDNQTHETYLDYLNTLSKKEQKLSYTYLIGNLIKQDRNVYTEYLHSSIYYLETLLVLNQKFIPDLQIHKVYVDEVIVNKPLVIKSINNYYDYTVAENKFNLFVKKLESIGKQAYFSKLDGIDINHDFKYDDNLVTEAENILLNSMNKSDMINKINDISHKLINKTYPIEKLIEIKDEKEIIHSEFGKMPYFKGSTYNNDYYYQIWLELIKYILLI